MKTHPLTFSSFHHFKIKISAKLTYCDKYYKEVKLTWAICGKKTAVLTDHNAPLTAFHTIEQWAVPGSKQVKPMGKVYLSVWRTLGLHPSAVKFYKGALDQGMSSNKIKITRAPKNATNIPQQFQPPTSYPTSQALGTPVNTLIDDSNNSRVPEGF